MSTILKNSMMKNLTCSACEKYLSVLPVKVYPDRRIKCGRCCEEGDGGIESLYGSAMKKCLFECINRYEGCNKLLVFSEVAEHESECPSGNYNCPKCGYRFSGSAYYLLLHYSKQHPKSILRNETFFLKLKKNFRDSYLYLVMDRIFFVLVENLSKDAILYLSIVSLIPHKNVTQWFTVKQFYKQNASTTTEKKTCLALDQFECDYHTIQTSSMNEVNCRFHIDLSQDIRIVDQISVQKPEKDALVSVYTQTGPTKLRYPLSRRGFDIRYPSPQSNRTASASEDHEEQERNASKSAIVSVYTQTDLETVLSNRIASSTEGHEEQDHNASKSAYVQTLSNVLGVKLTDEFKAEYPGYELTPCGTALFKGDDRVELACSNCRQLTGCNVFNCQLNRHIVCWDCKAWCGICDTPTNGWNVKITDMNELLLLPCKWECGEHIHGSRLTQHELHCEKPKFNCPSCGRREMNLVTLNSHLVSIHGNYKNINQFNLTGYLKERKGQVIDNVCFFYNGQCFKMSWRRLNGLLYEATIESFGNISLYEVAIVCDEGKLYNKVTDGKVVFDLNDNPKFYLKRMRNL